MAVVTAAATATAIKVMMVRPLRTVAERSITRNRIFAGLMHRLVIRLWDLNAPRAATQKRCPAEESKKKPATQPETGQLQYESCFRKCLVKFAAPGKFPGQTRRRRPQRPA